MQGIDDILEIKIAKKESLSSQTEGMLKRSYHQLGSLD